MPLEETEGTVRQYLDALSNGGDFAAFFADEVVWTTMETGEQIQGRAAVRDFIIGLHHQWFDASPELVNITFADDVAGLEAVFVGTHTAGVRGVRPATVPRCGFLYSVFYDVAGRSSSRCALTSPSARWSSS